MPSLRDRISDIEAIAQFFLHKFSSKMGKKIQGISSEYLLALQNHSWKGNIRELRNVIERSVILTDSSMLGSESLPLDFQNSHSSATKDKTLSAFELAGAEKIHIQKVLNYTNGNKTETAKLLNIGLTTLYRKIAEYGIQA